MTKKIIADVSVGPDATEWYGQLIIKKIRQEDGSPVTINKWLGIGFKSPAAVNPSNFWYQTKPYVEIDPKITDRQIGEELFIVQAKLKFAEKYTIDENSDTVFTFGINGNLIKDPSYWTNSFVFAVEFEPHVV